MPGVVLQQGILMRKLSGPIAFVAVVLATPVLAQDVVYPPEELSRFAVCLKAAGLTMYTAWWCPYCKAQLKMFGDSAKALSLVECSSPGTKQMNNPLCSGLHGVPAWKTKTGSVWYGLHQFSDLAELSGCKAPAAQANRD